MVLEVFDRPAQAGASWNLVALHFLYRLLPCLAEVERYLSRDSLICGIHQRMVRRETCAIQEEEVAAEGRSPSADQQT